MAKGDQSDEAMCEDCKKLAGRGWSTQPHANLVLTDEKRVPTIMGAADEENYSCSNCGHEWLRETGSAGLGWVK